MAAFDLPVGLGPVGPGFLGLDSEAVADGSGSVSYTVNVTPDIAPNTYGVVTLVVPGQGTGEDMEASKRFALIDVVG